MANVPGFLRGRMMRLLGKGSYGRDTFVNTLGLLIVAFVPIAALPILSRLYSPEDFGLFGVFTAAVGLGTIASTGRYEAAVMLPKEDQTAIGVAIVASVFVLGVTALLAMGVTIAYLSGVALVRDNAVLAFMAVVAVAFSGCVQVLLNTAIRHRMFLKVNYARVSGAITAALLSIAIGFYHSSSVGLALGLTSGYVISSLVLLGLVARQYQDVSFPDRKTIVEQAKRYRNFPFFSLPSDFSNTLAANLPIIFFSNFFGPAATGYLTMFQRIWAGTSVVVTGLGETFRQRAAAEHQESGNFNRTMRTTLLSLACLSVVLCLSLIGLGPTLFEVVVGPQWREAGVYGKILAPFVCLQFIASPVSWSFYISERLKLLSLWQFSLLVFFLISLSVGTNYVGPRGTLAILSVTASILYIVYISVSERISRK